MESESNRTLLPSAIRGDEVLFPYELMYSDCPGETARSMHINACKKRKLGVLTLMYAMTSLEHQLGKLTLMYILTVIEKELRS